MDMTARAVRVLACSFSMIRHTQALHSRNHATQPALYGSDFSHAETLFRMAEEALRNIERHATASRVTVTLSMKNDTHLCLRIDDDGIGFLST